MENPTLPTNWLAPLSNPMSGRWTTEPIVTPYFRIGKKMRLELPVGGLLKAAIWGDRDNPLRFQPRPMPIPQQKQ